MKLGDRYVPKQTKLKVLRLNLRLTYEIKQKKLHFQKQKLEKAVLDLNEKLNYRKVKRKIG